MRSNRLLVFSATAMALAMLLLALLFIAGGAFGRYEQPGQMRAGEILAHLGVVTFFASVYFAVGYLALRRQGRDIHLAPSEILLSMVSAAAFFALLAAFHGHQVFHDQLYVSEYGGMEGTFVFRSIISAIKAGALFIGMMMAFATIGHKQSMVLQIIISCTILASLAFLGFLFKKVDLRPSENFIYILLVLLTPLLIAKSFQKMTPTSTHIEFHHR